MGNNFLKSISEFIGLSVYDKKGGKVSSTRISSYFILGGILTAVLAFIGIDVMNAIIALKNKGFYEVPANHIVLYGMTLAHHLALLNINKTAERKVNEAIQENIKIKKASEPTGETSEEDKI